MKPAPFEYVRPASLAEACEILAGDDDSRVIAGGQTLVPMLAMRLARPARLIDILRLPELAGIRQENGAIVVGATLVHLFRTEGREEDHVTDGRRVGEQHHETVDADAEAAGRRQAVLERADVVLVDVHRFVIAG